MITNLGTNASHPLYSAMSSCIYTFKQIPKQLDEFLREPNIIRLERLMECANKFVQLGNCQIGTEQNSAEQKMQLFHRFFCRLREIIYSYLSHYVQTNGKGLIKNFLIHMNKDIIGGKSGPQASVILKKIVQRIVSTLKIFALTANFSSEVLDGVLNKQKMFYEKPQILVIPQQILTQPQPQLSSPLTPSESPQQKKSISSHGLDAIIDLDINNLSKYHLIEKQDLVKQCLNRNRTIKFNITNYNEKFEVYNKKPVSKKNRPQTHFSPTKLTTTFIEREEKKEGKEKNNISIVRKYKSMLRTNLFEEEQAMREEVMKQIQERKKYFPPKITITGKDLCFKPIHHSRTIHSSRKERGKAERRKSQGKTRSYCRKDTFGQISKYNSISFCL